MNKLLSVIVIGVILALMLGFSWAVVVGFIKLITMCFGLAFSIKMATGVWLVIVLINLLIPRKDK